MTKKICDPIFRRALIAMHCTQQDDHLLAFAGMLARQNILGEIHFVHVLPGAKATGNREREVTLLAEMEAKTRQYLAGIPAELLVKHELRHGPLVDGLLEYVATEHVDLALVGHRQDHPLRRSLARRLTKLAPCSVLLVPEGAVPTIERMLAPIDFSPRSAASLGVACKLAAAIGLSELTALHVYFDESRTTYEGADESLRGNEALHFNNFIAPIDLCGVKVRPLFREGVHPAHTIRDVASELSINLTVMETRGRTTSAGILLGSVAQETLVESNGPVLVVKQSGAKIGVLRALLSKLLQTGPGETFD